MTRGAAASARRATCWKTPVAELKRPLAGRRVLITRAAPQAPEFARQLESLGAEAVQIPTIEIRPVVDSPRIRMAIELLPETQLVVFTSANAVKIFCDFLVAAGHGTSRLGTSKLCAIGSETARALQHRDLEPALIAVAQGNSAIATARLARLDEILATRPADAGGLQTALRARADILVVSETLTDHAAYFDAGTST